MAMRDCLVSCFPDAVRRVEARRVEATARLPAAFLAAGCTRVDVFLPVAGFFLLPATTFFGVAVFFLATAFLLAAAFFVVATFFEAAVFFTGAFRVDVLRAVDLEAAVFFAALLRAGAFFAAVFFTDALRAAAFFGAALAAAVFFAAVLRALRLAPPGAFFAGFALDAAALDFLALAALVLTTGCPPHLTAVVVRLDHDARGVVDRRPAVIACNCDTGNPRLQSRAFTFADAFRASP